MRVVVLLINIEAHLNENVCSLLQKKFTVPEPVSIGARLQNEITEGSTLWDFQYFARLR